MRRVAARQLVQPHAHVLDGGGEALGVAREAVEDPTGGRRVEERRRRAEEAEEEAVRALIGALRWDKYRSDLEKPVKLE